MHPYFLIAKFDDMNIVNDNKSDVFCLDLFETLSISLISAHISTLFYLRNWLPLVVSVRSMLSLPSSMLLFTFILFRCNQFFFFQLIHKACCDWCIILFYCYGSFQYGQNMPLIRVRSDSHKFISFTSVRLSGISYSSVFLDLLIPTLINKFDKFGDVPLLNHYLEWRSRFHDWISPRNCNLMKVQFK